MEEGDKNGPELFVPGDPEMTQMVQQQQAEAQEIHEKVEFDFSSDPETLQQETTAPSFYGNTGEGEQTSFYPTEVKAKPVLNADEVAAQAAFIEAEFTGKPFDEVFLVNKAILDTSSAKQLQDKAAATVTNAYAVNAEETFSSALAEGDMASANNAAEYLRAAPVLNFEDSLVATGTGKVTPEEMAANADNMFVYNKLNELLADASDKVSGFDYAGLFGHAFLPAHNARVRNNAIERVIGDVVDFESISDVEVVNAFRDALLGLGSREEQEEFLDKFYDALVDESGVMDENYLDVVNILQQVLNFTTADTGTENAWAVFDAATIGVVGMGKALVRGSIQAHAAIKAKGKTVKVLDELDNKPLAAEAVAKDIAEETDIAGLPVGEAVAKALSSGHNPMTLDSEILKGASDTVKKGLRDQAIRRDVQELIATRGHSGVTKEEITKITQKWEKEYAEGSTPNVKEMELIEADDLGATYAIHFKSARADGGFASKKAANAFAKRNGITNYSIDEVVEEGHKAFYVKGKYRRDYKADDLSAIEVKGRTGRVTDWIPNFLASPAHVLKLDEVATAAVNVHKEATARAIFNNLWKDAYKGLPKTSKANVQAALTKGDAEGKVFTYEQLTRAADNAGMGLTEQEALSYFKARTVRDISFVVHDKAVTDTLKFRGFSKLAITGTDEFPAFETAGKVYSVDEAKKFYTTGETTGFDVASGKIIPLTDETIDSLYKQGNSVVRVAHPEDMRGISHDILITRTDGVKTSELVHAVPYRQGEFSRMYSDDWFVSIGKRGYKNGKETTYQQTIRTAPTHKAAESWVNAHNAAIKVIRNAEDSGTIRGISKQENPEGYAQAIREEVSDRLAGFDDSETFAETVLRGDIDYKQNFVTKFDREVPTASAQKEQVEAMFSQGKLFTGQRGERLKSVTGEDAPIKSISEAMAKEMAYVSNFSSLAKWRETQVDQILNTFEKHLEPGASKYETALLSPVRPSAMAGGTEGLSHQELQYLTRWRAHVRTRMGMPSDAALQAKDRLTRLSKWAEGVPYLGGTGAKVIRSFATSSPTDWMRTATFHSFLGMGNLAQLLVQANGAAIAATLHPVHGIKAGFSYPVIRLAILADSMGNKAALKALSGKVDYASLGMTGKEELLETVELVRKTGILNDIKSSALHFVKEGAIDLEGNDLVHAMGVWKQGKTLGRKALDLGLQPYQRGEETARIIALDIARREWKKLNPGKSPLSRQAMNEIVTLQDKYTMGMTRGNMGRFQQGFASVPLQFAQFNIKLMESLLGKTLSPPEKMRLLIGGTALYGSEGMGLTWVAQEIFGADAINALPEDQKFALMEGGMSYLVKAVTGAELAIGTRVGPGEYYANLTKAMVGEKSFVELVGGASGSFVAKQFGAYGELHDLMAYKTEDWSFEDTVDAFEVLAKSMSAGANNFIRNYKAITTDRYIRNKYGAPIVKLDEPTLVGGMFGIRSHKEITNWRVNKELKSVDKLVFSVSGDYETMLRNVYNASTQAEHDRAVKQWHIFKNAMLEVHGPHIALEAERKARQRAGKGDSMFARGLIRSNKPPYKHADVETISTEQREF